MKKIAVGLLVGIVWAFIGGASAQNVPRIIFDTDMYTDYDDVGALAMLHVFADRGECEIAAIVSNTHGDGNKSVAACEVINAYYGRNDLPIGCARSGGVEGAGGRGFLLPEHYAQYVRYPVSTNAPAALDVMRRALQDSPDKSVVLCSLGFLNNVADLVRTPEDRALVVRKVKEWVCMAFVYPKGKEHNSMLDPASSAAALENWPQEVPVTFIDFNAGRHIYSGRAVANLPDDKPNPVREVFARRLPPCEKIIPGKSWDQMAGHPSWDELAVLVSVKGWKPYFNLQRGTFRMVGTDGDNIWEDDPKSNRGRVTEKLSKEELGRILDEVMCTPPKSPFGVKGVLGETADFHFSNGTIGTYQDALTSVNCAKGTKLVDFGRDAFGWLEVRGGGSGEVCLGEKLANGRIDRKSGGTIRVAVVSNFIFNAAWQRVPLAPDARNTNTKAGAVLMPEEVGVIMPFRYVEVPEGVEVRRVVIAWPMKQKVKWGAPAIGDPSGMMQKLNELFDFCAYSIRATTYAGVYVDGDRERIAYEGDAYINMLGQLYGVDGDPELARRTIRHLLKHPTWPAEWQMHMVLCVWEDWHFTGETNFVAEVYGDLRKKTLIDLVKPGEVLIRSAKGTIVDWPVGERDGYDMSAPYNAVVNAFHYRTLCEMSDLAKALGKTDDAAFYAKRAETVKVAYNEILFDEKTGLYRDGKDSAHSSLHANVAALDFGLVPAEKVKGVADFIVAKGMACSPYFAQYLLEALFKNGKEQAALALLTSEGPRSWLGMMRQGSTLTMEAWSLKAKPNQDWNHAWGAAPANLLPRFLPTDEIGNFQH